MGKKKTTQTNTYQYLQKPETKDTSALRALIEKADFTTPVVNAYGQLEKQIGDEYYEDTLPEEAVNRIRAGKLFNLKQQKGADLANATTRQHEYKTANMAALAAGTAPQLVQTGGTATQSGGFWGDLILGATAGAGQGAIAA